MEPSDSPTDALYGEPNPDPTERGMPSAFEKLITDQPPVLQSLIAQLPTQSVLALSHTSSYLNNFLRNSPTSWRYISWRLYQPALTTATPTNNATGTGPRQSSNYALDQLLLYVINPFSTRLASLELDNTAVSGATLFQTVMILRKDTLEHVSVRGCKNVSLKYHINPWLMMHAMALDRIEDHRAPGYEKLALKSLYTYRCRHHRRRPYLPSSLARKESDSEPTHELVQTCHKLGIWTDTAWCTTPGARCFRRRGYVTMRVPQDLRDVWVVYDRLWRSRNWLGPVPENRSQTTPANPSRKRKRDCRSWEFDEEAMNGESVASKGEGKAIPMHLRATHQQFVQNIYCDSCSDPILERCEQCSVMMHCSGCRKTLCASCAFDRPYLRNKMATEEERNRFWWAPGCAVSPCSMQDQDPSLPGPGGNNAPAQVNNSLPTIRFRWCCTEPIFSGGGGITFGNGQSRDTDRIRAAPLPMTQQWEDPEFRQCQTCTTDVALSDPAGQIGVPLFRANVAQGPGGRWPSIDSLFRRDSTTESDFSPSTVPRILCDECYQSDQWKIKCRACSVALCLKHDVRDRLKVRICGYKDLAVEKAEFRSRQKALKLLTMLMMKRRKSKGKAGLGERSGSAKSASTGDITESTLNSLDAMVQDEARLGLRSPKIPRTSRLSSALESVESSAVQGESHSAIQDMDLPNRPISPGSNSTGPPSRASSPTPSARSLPITPGTKNTPQRPERTDAQHPVWRGCQSFFCPTVRGPGDHRRRCVAIMRSCAECKTYVCELCTVSLDPPCPCKGCRAPAEEGHGDTSADANLRFFCPNCRWARMVSGKCKRKPVLPSTKTNPKKRKNKIRPRKPLEERRGNRRAGVQDTADGLTRDISDGLLEFFEGLQMTNSGDNESAENGVAPESGTTVPGEEIRELEDMGALARDLIRRIQTLRLQFGPNSLEALALPDIRVDDNGIVQHHVRAMPQRVDPAPVPQPVQVEIEHEEDDNAQASSSGTGT